MLGQQDQVDIYHGAAGTAGHSSDLVRHDHACGAESHQGWRGGGQSE